MADTLEPYASTPESTVTGELLVHRGLGRDLLVLLPPSYGSGGPYLGEALRPGRFSVDPAGHRRNAVLAGALSAQRRPRSQAA